MSSKSEAIVGFIANLRPLYSGERHDGLWCVRSLADGTLILPVGETASDDERGWVRVRWQGDPSREQEQDGGVLAALALERYVRLHGTGYGEDAIAAEVWFLARHFHVKTGCEAYFPQLREPPGRLRVAGHKVLKMGEGLLVNYVSKATGLG